MLTEIRCPDCQAISQPRGSLPVGSPIRCSSCDARFLTWAPYQPPVARRVGRQRHRSAGQVLGVGLLIGLSLVAAYGLGRTVSRRHQEEVAPGRQQLQMMNAGLQPTPLGSDAPADVARALQTATDPATRLAIVQEGRVVLRHAPGVQQLDDLLRSVATGFRLRPTAAADRIIALAQATADAGARLSPAQILDAADLYMHSPRFKAGQRDFERFVADYREVRRTADHPWEVLERLVQLR